jgi:site-specific DNA-methyltransferase (adenine-specific)
MFRNQILCGDAFKLINDLPDQSIDCIITSPPYYAMRDNGLEGQIGLEKHPQEYANKLVEFFELAKRALKNTGTVWVVIMDSYAGNNIENHSSQYTKNLSVTNLCGTPWRFAFGMQNRGWIWRDVIIWDKLDKVMPEPRTYKRCTRGHEYILMFAKQKDYYYDWKAMLEKGIIPAGSRGAKGSLKRRETPGVNARPVKYKIYDGLRKKRSVWKIKPRPIGAEHYSSYPVDLIKPCISAGCPPDGIVLDPFGGTGTTAEAAIILNRMYLLFEINCNYVDIARSRVKSIIFNQK